MRITRVELESIKSYRRATIELRDGTTAIRGANGAGKSTLVEAIGFALFDAMTYKHAQFVREGERTGTVTVTFCSALDDREYQAVRRCGGSSEWYIYDPQLETRVVEQRTDVEDFLRRHLRIENTIRLGDLFTDAIGVPQGTFTADFLLTPAQRKRKFDALLQVEDYATAAEKLLETRHHLREQRATQEQRIAGLERETAQLDACREEYATTQRRERQASADLARVTSETNTVRQQYDQAERQQQLVTRLETQAQLAQARHAAAHSQQTQAARQAAEARTAADHCAASRADYDAFLLAEQQMLQVRQRERERDALRRQHAQSEADRAANARDEAHARQQHQEASAAATRLADLAPAIRHQEALEAQRDLAERERRQLTDAQAQRDARLREREQLANEQAQSERHIADLEAHRAEAELLPARQAEMEAIAAALTTRATHEQRLRALRSELAQGTAEREKAAAQEARADENVQRILRHSAVVAQLPTLEHEHATLEAEVRRLEASVAHWHGAREHSGQGQCPFLQEPCLNIAQRGENSLVVYFDRVLARDEQTLSTARTRWEAAQAALEHARKVHRFVEQREMYEEQLRQAHDRTSDATARVTRLLEEQRTLEAMLAAAPTAAARDEARAALERSRAADRALATLPAAQQGLARSIKRLAAVEAEVADLGTRCEALATAPQRLADAQAALAALGDPRHEAATCQGVAARLPEFAARVEQCAAEARRLEAASAALAQDLLPYATLDDELRTLTETQERTREGHRRYLQHEQLAARLPALQYALGEAETALRAAAAEYTNAQAAYEAARAGFDAGALDQVRTRLDALTAEGGRLAQDLKHAQESSARLEAEIARVEALLVELAAAQTELSALAETEQLLQQFRDTIKEAGPHIMAALLRQISVEANRIFGEVLGDRSAQLSWEQDYEIVLRRDGRARSFAQLSGGEQMSAALAVRLALLRTLSRLDIAFFDEPTQNMDEERRTNLAEQLRRVRGFDQLLVISHDDTFEQGLDSVIQLEKHGGETRLVSTDALVTAP